MSFCCHSVTILHCVVASGPFLRAPEGLQGRVLFGFASAASRPGLGMEEKPGTVQGQDRLLRCGGLGFSPAGPGVLWSCVSLRADLHISDLPLDLASPRSPGL